MTTVYNAMIINLLLLYISINFIDNITSIVTNQMNSSLIYKGSNIAVIVLYGYFDYMKSNGLGMRILYPKYRPWLPYIESIAWDGSGAVSS